MGGNKLQISNFKFGFLSFGICLFLAFLLLVSSTALAQEDSTPYNLLEPLPHVSSDGQTTTAGEYIPGIVKLIIGIAGVLAVIKIIFGGIQYMSTDAIEGKSEGKQHIQNALWGLLLIISAWIILFTINPNLVTLNFNIEQIELGDSFEVDVDNPFDSIPETDWWEGCHDCIPMAPHLYQSKPVGQGCARTNPVNGAEATVNYCLVNRALNAKLINLAATLEKFDIPLSDWRVTEGYPPTTTHKSACHNPQDPPSRIGGGTCVDIAFLNSPASSLNINKLFKALDATHFTIIYEVPTEARKNEILRGFVPNERSQYNRRIRVSGTAEHAHIR